MNTFTKIATTSALLFAIAAPASAAVSPNLLRNVIFASGANSNVSVSVQGDTVTLRGYVEDQLDFRNIERAARNSGAKKVINGVLWNS